MTTTPQAVADITELADVLETLLRWRLAGEPSEPPVTRSLPGWVCESFSEPLSAVELESWLASWRQASPAEKALLEEQKGWEFEQWIHWFSSDNDIWSLESVSVDSPEGLVIILWHVDDPFPFGALEWLAKVGGFTLGSPMRIE